MCNLAFSARGVKNRRPHCVGLYNKHGVPFKLYKPVVAKGVPAQLRGACMLATFVFSKGNKVHEKRSVSRPIIFVPAGATRWVSTAGRALKAVVFTEYYSGVVS